MWFKNVVKRLVPANVAQAIQWRRLNRVMAKHTKRVVSHRYGDGKLVVELADPLAAGWYDHDWPLPVEIELLRRSRLRPGAVVFDLGAHQGVMALMLGREVGPTGRVIAVEALPHNAAAAVRNRELNQMPWVEVVPAAVAGRTGTLIICRALNAQVAAANDYAGTIEVPAVTIDDLADRYGRPDVIYLDVEGMELAALEGGRRSLASHPDVFVEVHTKHGLEAVGGSVDQILAHFPAPDYDTFVYTEAAAITIPLASAPASLLADRFFLTALSRQGRAGA